MAEKQLPRLWLRSRRRFQLAPLASGGLDDGGGGYSGSVSHMMKVLSLELALACCRCRC
jgi:hypothetical protein